MRIRETKIIESRRNWIGIEKLLFVCPFCMKGKKSSRNSLKRGHVHCKCNAFFIMHLKAKSINVINGKTVKSKSYNIKAIKL